MLASEKAAPYHNEGNLLYSPFESFIHGSSPEASQTRADDNLAYVSDNRKLRSLNFEGNCCIKTSAATKTSKIKRSYADYAGRDEEDCDEEGDNKSEDIDKLGGYEREEAHYSHEFRSFLPRSIRQWGGKDRHSKVLTSRGVLRDRRVRLSVSTAIRFYDVQDRLGFDQPSKAIEWLLDKAQWALEHLPFNHISPPSTPFIVPTSSKPHKTKLQNRCNSSKGNTKGGHIEGGGNYTRGDSPSPRISSLTMPSCTFANESHHNELSQGVNFDINYGLDDFNSSGYIKNNNIMANNDLNLCDLSSFEGGAKAYEGQQAHNGSIVGSNFVDNVIVDGEASNGKALEIHECGILYEAARQYNVCNGNGSTVQEVVLDMENSMGVAMDIINMEKAEKESSLRRAGSMKEGEGRMAQLYKSLAAAASAIDLQSPIIMINQAAYLCSTPPLIQASYLINIAGDHAVSATNNVDTVASLNI